MSNKKQEDRVVAKMFEFRAWLGEQAEDASAYGNMVVADALMCAAGKLVEMLEAAGVKTGVEF